MTSDNPYTKDEKTAAKAAEEMDRIAKTIFAPVYPAVAAQIKEQSGIRSGNCIDLGSGPASLSISLARITDLNIHVMDASEKSFKIATQNIEAAQLQDRVVPVLGNVEDIPFEDNFADLIISRGSVFFWENLIRAFNEIYRVLKPGGKTFIGGGFGSRELKIRAFEQMAERSPGFKGKLTPDNIQRICAGLERSDIRQYEIVRSDWEFWIHITKEAEDEI